MDPHPPSPNEETLIDQAFDVEKFRAFGHEVVDLLADALDQARAGEVPVRVDESPQDAVEFWDACLQAGGAGEAPQRLVEETIARAFRSHHPHNLGHQVGPVLPAAAVLEFVGSFLDTGNGVFEVGNPATPMEHVVLRDLAARLGMPEEADGILTSGGSLGNLTALLAMRQYQAKNWDQGSSGSKYAVLVSEEAHYCVIRSAKIMGWGDSGVISVPVDDAYRMRPEALDRALADARARGIEVLGVVGSAGSTATGAIDPLGEIADFCEEQQLWFHVDAAHSGAFVFSQNARHLLDGIGRADSVVIDFHKMLLSPSLLTAVLFKRGGDSFNTFAQQADYLWREDGSSEWWDLAKRTLECTRPMLGLRAYGVMTAGRDGLFQAYIDHALEVTQGFAQLVGAADDFELLVEPESNILCYRLTPEGVDEGELDQMNERIRKELADSGDFYIVQIVKHGRTYLRSAVMNPFADTSICAALLERIRTSRAAVEARSGGST